MCSRETACAPAYVLRYGAFGGLDWADTFEAPIFVAATGVTVVEDGAVLVAGHSNGAPSVGPFVADLTTPSGQTSAFVARFASDGAPVSLRGFESQADPEVPLGPGVSFAAIVALPEGAYAFAGSVRGRANLGDEQEPAWLTSPDGQDGFVARYDDEGVFGWTRQLSGPSSEDPTHIAATPDVVVVAVGTFAEDVFCAGSEMCVGPEGPYDTYLVRYRADGTTAWSTRVRGPGREDPHGLTVAVDGSVVMTGVFDDTARFGDEDPIERAPDPAIGRAAFLARWNEAGELAWVRRLDIQDGRRPVGVVEHEDGRLVVAGSFEGTALFENTDGEPGLLGSLDGLDVYLSAYDPDGALSSLGRVGGPGDDQTTGIAADCGGGVLIGSRAGPNESRIHTLTRLSTL